LFGRELDHAALGRLEAGEDPSVCPEVGMAHMRALDRAV
jgi:hypothetical protein